MIRELSLGQFKCFEQLSLPLGKLTLLAGVNASGKSTIIQALALLHQSIKEAEWGSGLILDGNSVRLGALGDVVDKVYGRRSFELGLAGDGFSVRWTFGEPDEQDRESVLVPIHELIWAESDTRTLAPPDGSYRALLPAALASPLANGLRQTLAEIDYVGAERLGPRETYRLAHEDWHDYVGVQGERTPGCLWWFGDSPVSDALCVGDGPKNLRTQTQAWLERFFAGVMVQVERVLNANLVTLGVRTSAETNFHRPQHVGYGITHVLPLIVAGLRARPGRMLVVENPEVHLHPAGQAAMGLFLARVASQGATVVVETHSDHVLNGVRRAVRDGLLATDDVKIHFFRERAVAKEAGLAQVVSPTLDGKGNIDHWPEGFFDQFDRDMTYLAGFGG